MKLNKILINLGISSNKLGFNYISDAILYLKNNNVRITEIYEHIANEYNVKSSSIERAIRHSISRAYKVNNLIDRIYHRVPDNSEFIYDLTYNIDIFIDEINKMEEK